MVSALKIACADDERDMRDFYARLLPEMGYEVCGVAATGHELVSLCDQQQPNLVITDIKMPDMDGIDAAAEICRRCALPVILVSAYHEKELLERAREDCVMGYLVKPIEEADLETAISVAMTRFEQFAAVKQEAAGLRQALADRKVIERAKGIIMKRARVSEEEAFKRLQRMSWNKNQKLAQVAETIILAEEAMAGQPS